MIDILFGFVCGFVSGLFPGFYITQLLLFHNSFEFIISSSVAFLFSSLFPTLLLSCPSSENHLIVLPSFKMLKRGEILKAVDISMFSLIVSIIFSAFFLFFLYSFLQYYYEIVKLAIPFLLVISLIMLCKNLKCAFIILVSSALGLLIMNQNLLVPMLTGFFGLSGVIISLSEKIPPQKIKQYDFSKFECIKTSAFSGFVSSIFAFVPAVSSNISSMFSKLVFEFKDENFISFTTSTNAYYIIFSFFAVFLIEKARTGPAYFLMNSLTTENAFYVLGIILLCSVIAFYVASKIKKSILFFFQKYRAQILVFSMFSVLLINFLFFGFYGLLALLTATLIGLLCFKLSVPRITCMSSMIVSTLAFYI